ncbi:hypothetical protein CDAR_13521 [Caerostris darwini]|uniref:Uncharacterized protein n=1 Tax=Caerostris darwini TaxID=1538125 RepID=A0AAV4UDU4_9ARAC|nr:hypothetical protein CDAR_13521 [Caerostris darwini]
MSSKGILGAAFILISHNVLSPLKNAHRRQLQVQGKSSQQTTSLDDLGLRFRKSSFPLTALEPGMAVRAGDDSPLSSLSALGIPPRLHCRLRERDFCRDVR